MANLDEIFVGATVRITTHWILWGVQIYGEEGTVVEINPGKQFPYVIEIPNLAGPVFLENYEFEVIQVPPARCKKSRRKYGDPFPWRAFFDNLKRTLQDE